MYEEECRRIPQVPDLLKKLTSLDRPIEPDEVASACLYLCSPAAAPVSALTLTMDTGATAGVTIM